VVIGLLGAVGVTVVAWSCYYVFQALGLFSGGSIGVALGLFVLILLAVPFCFGIGCLYLARRLQAADRVARVLVVVLCVSASAAFVLTGARDLALVLAAIACLTISGVLTLDPTTRSHFTGPWAPHRTEPTPVVAARILIVIVGSCWFLVGVMFLPLAEISASSAGYGVLFIGLAAVLFTLSRRLSRGDPSARVLITVLALVYALLSILAGHGEPGVILPVGLAGGVVGLLWLPITSRDYFSALPPPTRPSLAAIDRGLQGAVAALIPTRSAVGTDRRSASEPAPYAAPTAPAPEATNSIGAIHTPPPPREPTQRHLASDGPCSSDDC